MLLCLCVTLQAVEAMVTYYVDLEEYDKGRAVVEDYISELSSEGASEMATNIKTYVFPLFLLMFYLRTIQFTYANIIKKHIVTMDKGAYCI